MAHLDFNLKESIEDMIVFDNKIQSEIQRCCGISPAHKQPKIAMPPHD